MSPEVMEAWRVLEHTVYNAPKNYQGEGTVESLLCARPGFIWTERLHGDIPNCSIRLILLQSSGTRLMLSVAEQYKGNNNFEYDLVDVVRQSMLIRAMCCSMKFLKVMIVKTKIAFRKTDTTVSGT